jgi:small ligand-binding sensory domain FIST
MSISMQWANALSTRPSLEAAVNEVVSIVQRSLTASPDLGIVFLSSAFASDYPRLIPLLQEKMPLPVLIGCGGGGIVGMKSGKQVVEIENSPALSLTVACLPGVEVHPFRLDADSLPDLDSSPQRWSELLGVSPAKNPHFILLADAFTPNITDLLEGLDYAYPQSIKIGGLASGGASNQSNLFFDCFSLPRSRFNHFGTIGVALSGNIQVETIVAQGCRPIGEPIQVSQGERNIITEVLVPDEKTNQLKARLPLDVIRELVDTLSEKDRELAQHSLFIGIARDEFKLALQSGDFLIRNLLGVDPRHGAIAIGDRVRPGQRIQLHLRDAQTSGEDLVFLLENYHRAKVNSPQAIGALLFSCLGRGESLYGKPNFDSELFQRYLTQVPLGGFFCNGEIGPVGNRTFLHGYTSAFAIFRPISA